MAPDQQPHRYPLLRTLRILPCATIRPCFIAPHLGRITAQLHRAEFAQVDMAMAALPAEHLSALLAAIAELRRAPRWVTQWIKASPTSCHARLLLAKIEIMRAWSIRGESALRYIPIRRRVEFSQVMACGYQHLVDLADEDASQAMAFAELIHCNVVVGLGGAKRDEWLDHVMDVAPFHLPTLAEYSRGTQARWGGSEEEMFGFSSWVTENAPVGHLAHSLAAGAVIEKAFSVSDEEVDILWLARDVGDEALAEWTRRSLYKWLDATPSTLQDRLAATQQEREDGYGIVCTERFALASYLSGAKHEARLLLTALRGRLRPYPWSQFAPYVPLSGRWLARNHRVERFTHDRVCRDSGLDPRSIVR